MLRELIRPSLTSPAWGLLILRVIVGLGLLAHGFDKIFGLGEGGASNMVGFTGFVGGFGFPGPAPFWAWTAALSELVGGLLLLVGLFTRIAALLAVGVLLVAVWKVKWSQGWIGGFELDLLYLGGLLALFVGGPGALSLDTRLFGIRPGGIPRGVGGPLR